MKGETSQSLKNPMDNNPLNNMQIVNKNKNSVICIIGMHRSGTSMVTRLLNLCGLDLGPPEQLIVPDEYNSLGNFENDIFTNKINETLLAHYGGSWDNPPLVKEDWEYDPSLEQIINEARLLLKTFSKSPHWGWKDPRTTILLPFWKSLISNMRFVICIRNPLEVARSLSRRDRFPIKKGVVLWNEYMQAAIRDTEGCARLFVFYEDFFKDATQELNRLVEFCGLAKPNDPSIILNSISIELKHHTSEISELLINDKIITEYKLFYIGLRALATDKFLRSILKTSREELVSQNISKFFKLLEEFPNEQKIAQLQSGLENKEQQIIKLKNTVQSQQQLLDEKEQVIIHLSTEREKLAQNIAGLQADIKAKEQTIRQQAEQIDRITIEKNKLDHLLYFTDNSLGWKIITKLHDLENKFMPQGTSIRNTYNLFWKSMKTIFSQGWTRFVTDVKNDLKARKRKKLESNLTISSHTSRTVETAVINFSPEDKSILVIDEFIPAYDMSSGSLRMYSILEILKEIGFEVAFFPDDFYVWEPYATELRHKGINVIDKNTDVEEYLIKRGKPFSFVMISRPEQAFKYIPLIRAYFPFCPIIYDTVDLHWLRFERAASVTVKDEFLTKAKYYKSLELSNAERSDITFTVTYDEKKFLLEEMPELKIEVIPNIHEVIDTDRAFISRKDIMFIGGFYHIPNEDAVFYFIKEIFPIIKMEINDIRFYVVGSHPSEAILELNSEDILVTGYVKDVQPYFRNCRVFVSPLRYGAGMKGKIGQSMAYGLPVVTTGIGAEGIGLINGENALIADGPKEFADAVIELYRNQPLWNKINKKSIDHINQNYSKKVIRDKLVEIFLEKRQESKDLK